jgi:RNA polymerase sigma-70 factor (ECF subfamily)
MYMQDDSLAILLARSLSGDPEAFCSIVVRLQGPLSRYIVHIVGDAELAADLTQDTFLELYESLGRVDVRQLQSWLYRAATNNALSALRRRRRFEWLPLDWLRNHAAPSTPLDVAAGERLAVRAALGTLPREQAACLLLHDAAGLTCLEIAEQQGISLAAAKQRLARGRRAFLAAYTRTEPGGAQASLSAIELPGQDKP